ncbi:hypothetical protein OH492_16925 [Vibrio chagasii]|nr:hypothetical protein [Vibrio chagasii]
MLEIGSLKNLLHQAINPKKVAYQTVQYHLQRILISSMKQGVMCGTFDIGATHSSTRHE